MLVVKVRILKDRETKTYIKLVWNAVSESNCTHFMYVHMNVKWRKLLLPKKHKFSNAQCNWTQWALMCGYFTLNLFYAWTIKLYRSVSRRVSSEYVCVRASIICIFIYLFQFVHLMISDLEWKRKGTYCWWIVESMVVMVVMVYWMISF